MFSLPAGIFLLMQHWHLCITFTTQNCNEVHKCLLHHSDLSVKCKLQSMIIETQVGLSAVNVIFHNDNLQNYGQNIYDKLTFNETKHECRFLTFCFKLINVK